MNLFENKGNDRMIDLDYTYMHQETIQKVKQTFQSYGYEEILTSAFGQYDLYAQMNGTVNHHEMIKTIDNTGQVLVLRPDVTIPLTERLARRAKTIKSDLRYFYVHDVYRQSETDVRDRETLQAGVEYFGNVSLEADAEVIALAADIFKCNDINQFTIEIGHAGFFKQFVQQLSLSDDQLTELISYIRAKNVPDLERFTSRIQMSDAEKEILVTLPFLYGQKESVFEKAAKLPLSEQLNQTLSNLSEICHVLENYGIKEEIVIDLSLINHMDYYSGIIFQGFVKKVGKPILMGGRYDRLSEKFNAHIPAIGFAVDIPTLLPIIEEVSQLKRPMITCLVLYEKSDEKQALQLTQTLRKHHISTIALVQSKQTQPLPETSYTITCEHGQAILNNQTYDNHEAILQFIQSKER
ncbi:MAG TPA: ATP phosphoribosyltransferase regulatory subunit [Pseudogracilibacillus sp.]|nr:ATP phosphoribosyltransferase regulatory subunit [Pseudogracilibacillus sp.]